MVGQMQRYLDKNNVDELIGMHIRMWVSISTKAFLRTPTVAEAVNGPINEMTRPVEINELLSFITPELAQRYHEQSRGW